MYRRLSGLSHHSPHLSALKPKEHFDEFAENYDEKYAKIYGRFRIERITEVVDNFIGCGDYSQGIARVGEKLHPVVESPYIWTVSDKIKV
ncbi:hypothetical protein ES705_30544 [subsurface metagenome]